MTRRASFTRVCIMITNRIERERLSHVILRLKRFRHPDAVCLERLEHFRRELGNARSHAQKNEPGHPEPLSGRPLCYLPYVPGTLAPTCRHPSSTPSAA
jgi:hypothetical protein